MLNIFLLLIIVILSTFAYGAIKGAPYVPTMKNDIASFLKLANIKPEDKFVDIGCGDGRLLFASADQGAIATGYEISLIPYVLSKLKLLFLKEKDNVKIIYANFWKKNLHDADLVYFFLMPKFHDQLKEKFAKELRPGTKVIAYIWPVPGWEIITEEKTSHDHMLYLYTMK